MSKNLDASLASDMKKTAAFAVQIYLAYMLMVRERLPPRLFFFLALVFEHGTRTGGIGCESGHNLESPLEAPRC